MIGKALASYFSEHNVIGIGRNELRKDDKTFVKDYQKADIILNFAGSPIVKRWNKRNKEEIFNSRIETTRKLIRISRLGENKKRHFISASAIGIYSDAGTHTEESNKQGTGFMKELVQKWEAEALSQNDSSTIVSVLRIGVVLGPRGGMVQKILPLFKAGLGGKIGSGKQGFSWIHITDLIRAVEYIITEKKEGIYNIVSPGYSNNAAFTNIMGSLLKRPAVFTIPVLILKLIYGKGAELVCGGQNVIPGRLVKEGFSFDFPELESALYDIVN